MTPLVSAASSATLILPLQGKVAGLQGLTEGARPTGVIPNRHRAPPGATLPCRGGIRRSAS